jgi:hypothetical protein
VPIQLNRLACLRLTERCADILISVREEIAEAGDEVGEELKRPISKLVELRAISLFSSPIPLPSNIYIL